MKQIITCISILLSFCLISKAYSQEGVSAQRIPTLVVQFEKGSTDFNNFVVLNQKLASAKGVMISANTNSNVLSVADVRIKNLISKLDDQKFVFTTFRYTNILHEHDYVEIFALNDESEFEPLLREINSSSLVSGLGRLYTEKDIRQWRFEVEEKEISLMGGMPAVEQLSTLLKHVGWSLKSAPAFLNEIGILIKAKPLKMKVILVNGDTASKEEINSVIDSWLEVYGKGYGLAVSVNKKDNSVVIKS